MSEMPLASSKYNLTKALIDALLLYLLLYLPPSLPPSVAYPFGICQNHNTNSYAAAATTTESMCLMTHILIYIVKKQLTCFSIIIDLVMGITIL
jgi:hypothetical protein